MLPTRSLRLISVTSLILVAIASPASAQRLSIGGRLGLNIARLDLGPGANVDSRIGISFGGFFGYPLSQRFAVQPELLIVMKGAEFDVTYNGFTEATPDPQVTRVHFEDKLTYLELQVPLTLMIPAGSTAFTPRLYLGPSLAIELGCETGAEVSGNAVSPIDCLAETEKLDFGVVFGAGLDTRIGRGALTLDARYNRGLRDINAGIGEIRNRVVQLLVGYAYFFGG